MFVPFRFMVFMNWISHPLRLEGKHVLLRPLEPSDVEQLHTIAADERIWTHLPTNGFIRENLDRALEQAFQLRDAGEQYPFVIEDRRTGKLIGSTRYLEITPVHRKLEIGWTWLHPSVWATGINFECKLLLLTHAFETLTALRVQIKTGEQNLRSRAAILKIGAQFEGILRKDRIREDGTLRNTVVFSIIDEEWPAVKEMLTGKVPASL